MGTAYNTRGDRTGMVPVLDENGAPTGELMEGDTVSARMRIYPRDFVTVNLAAEYPITKKWIALVELTSTWDGGRLFGPKANVPPARCFLSCRESSIWPPTNSPWPWD